MSSDGRQECRTKGTATKERFCCEDLQTQADSPPAPPQRRLNLGYQWRAFIVLNEAPKSVAICENGSHDVYVWVSAVPRRAERSFFSPSTGVWR